MKIAIISDIHDNLVNLKKTLDWCLKNKVEKIVCCGDVTNFETIETMSKSFLGDIFLVSGNADIWYEEELEAYKNIKYLGEIGVVELDGERVGVCHEPFKIKDVLKKSVSIIFYGHTHKPWIEKRDKINVINPGTLGGMFFRASFAVWETGKIEPELKLVEELK